MAQRQEETTAIIRYDGIVRISGSALVATLRPVFEEAGAEFQHCGPTGKARARFVGRGLRISIGVVEDAPHEVIVRVETPVDLPNPREVAQLRFRLCTAAVRHFVTGCPAREVSWQHKGSRYLTAPGRETVVERPTVRRPVAPAGTGEAARRKAARRATAAQMTQALPEASRRPARPEDERRRAVDEARRRAKARLAPAPAATQAINQSLPAKLTLYTMNATLCVMALPVGAGMMTYNVLSGGSLAATGRAIALTGLALALAQIPALHQVAAIL